MPVCSKFLWFCFQHIILYFTLFLILFDGQIKVRERSCQSACDNYILEDSFIREVIPYHKEIDLTQKSSER